VVYCIVIVLPSIYSPQRETIVTISSAGVLTGDALFGGPLTGDAPLRFIYTDEAGTSSREPVVVMVGLIVHADVQLRPAEQLVQQLHATVPEKFRDGFISHATAVWGNKKYRPEWGREERLEFLCRMHYQEGIGGTFII
jgi:hypothetical protein